MLTRTAIVSLRCVRGASKSSVRNLSARASTILSALDIPIATDVPGVYDGTWRGNGDILESVCPTTGEVLARVQSASPRELHEALDKSKEAYLFLRKLPTPRRGDVLRQLREALAAKRDALGALVSLEMGKIRTEGIGEVQEFVDICDYAVGLSRMMNGRVVASERPGHTILEVPNPLGIVGALTAFNFPVAVYGWNFSLSFAAGNATIWKPSPTTPLCAIAVTKIIADVLERNGIPGAVSTLVTGAQDVGEAIVNSADIPLVSFTGSEAVGRVVGKAVQSRFGKTILELGGNNASIIMPDADLSMAVPAVFFGAVGTAGQRCTSTRRLYLHRDIAPPFLDALQKLAIERLREKGAQVLTGGQQYDQDGLRQGNFVQPTIAIPESVDPADSIWSTETFAPVLNVGVFDELEQAIGWNNAVPQGLSSSLWTRDMRNIGKWIGSEGSDTGIVNVNVGTSGAEIGAAFGGNKSTGWGRESGGDAWKQYVRWSACTINFSDATSWHRVSNFRHDGKAMPPSSNATHQLYKVLALGGDVSILVNGA
ncbi:Aldehyde/histidinol dehydrogenase [Boletus reticuloceps]|uniref:aldehyde dehydrogenase (NAD(+)) n=1 Tax=Boletus reticuloceps TaxID=495285 RepID=A0A8I3AF84_9AGAM|nr:Aldehyde/histidinol dehydrogenase [Boletus reticuloceps]